MFCELKHLIFVRYFLVFFFIVAGLSDGVVSTGNYYAIQKV